MLRKISILAIGVLALMIAISTVVWWNHIRIHGSVVEIEFAGKDGTILRGDIYLPNGNGTYPGVVLLLGSGPEVATMIDYQIHANAFLKKGIAVLSYDKRGAGRSDGDFETATYADFVEDGLAAVATLRARPELGDDLIGLFGLSEGGWLTPEVAVRDGRIAFIVNTNGSSVAAGETYLWEIRNELVEAGVTGEILLSRILDLRVDIWSYYRDALEANGPLPERRALLEARLAEIDGPWRDSYSMGVAEFEAEKYRRWLIDILYDPQPFLANLDMPLYATFAGEDQNIPTEQSVEFLEHLRETQSKDITIRVYSGRRHSLVRWYNIPTFGYPHDYLNSIGRWAAEKTT